MLQSINDNAKGWVAYLIVGLISVPFALWGIQEYIGGGGQQTVATVNGEEIGLREVQNEVAQQRQRLTSMFGKLPPGFDDNNLKRSALESLVNQELQRQYAEDNGFRASGDEVIGFLHSLPQFQRDGQFDPEIYKQVIASQGRSPAGYEQQMRGWLTQDQFRNAIGETAFLPQSEMANYQRLMNQTRDMEVYTVKLSDQMSQLQLEAAEIEKYYQDNPNLFQTEEKVKVSYVELDEEEIAKTIEPTEDELQAWFEENASLYFDPEQFKISLIKVNVTDAQDAQQAEQKAQDVLAKIKAGELDFATVVSSLQDDSLYFESGENVGMIKVGVLNKAIDDAVMAANPGDVVGPVDTGSSWELIQVLEKQPARDKPFEEVRNEVTDHLVKDRVKERFEEQYEILRTVSYENDGSLQPVANELQSEIKTSDWFTRSSGKGIAENREVIEAAFSQQVLEQGINSPVIDVKGAKAVVLRLEGNEKPQLRPMDEVRADIETRLKQEKARAGTQKQGDDLYAKVQQQGWGGIEDAADKVEKFADVARTSDKVPAYLLQPLFKMTVPETGKSGWDKVVAPNGDYAIVQLTGVKDGEAELKDADRDIYATYMGNREQVLVMKALREIADVQTFPERLQEE